MENKKTELRSQSRNHVFNLMFEYCFSKGENIDEMTENYYDCIASEIEEEKLEYPGFECAPINKRFVEKELKAIIENLEDIDKVISENCRDWDIDRLLKTDLSALRIAVYEILFDDDIPDAVSASEAVKLAKEYGNDKSGSFVNGLVASVIKGK